MFILRNNIYFGLHGEIRAAIARGKSEVVADRRISTTGYPVMGVTSHYINFVV